MIAEVNQRQHTLLLTVDSSDSTQTHHALHSSARILVRTDAWAFGNMPTLIPQIQSPSIHENQTSHNYARGYTQLGKFIANQSPATRPQMGNTYDSGPQHFHFFFITRVTQKTQISRADIGIYSFNVEATNFETKQPLWIVCSSYNAAPWSSFNTQCENPTDSLFEELLSRTNPNGVSQPNNPI
jgi:hypothetical protein